MPIIKPIIKEKVVKTRLFSTLSSYLWAATGVGIAMQKNFGVDNKDNWANLEVNPITRIKNLVNHRKVLKTAAQNNTPVTKYKTFIQDFGSKFKDSFKEFINGKNPKTKIAGRVLLGAAIGMTLLGNFLTLFDFNKYKGKKPHAASSLIDESKEKVVC